MRQRQWSFLVLCLTLAACDEATRAERDPLIGAWVTPPEAVQPAGSVEYALYFSADGRFTARSTTVGVYPGQRATDLSTSQTTSGRYRAEGDRLFFEPDSLVVWDSFHGDAPPVVHRPYPYGTLYEDARYRVRGNELTLSHLTYPADAPVRWEQTFHRVLLD